jgi:hypothetical protein
MNHKSHTRENKTDAQCGQPEYQRCIRTLKPQSHIQADGKKKSNSSSVIKGGVARAHPPHSIHRVLLAVNHHYPHKPTMKTENLKK